MYPPEVTSCYAPKVRGIYYPATDTYEDLDGLRARVVELTINLAEKERERVKAVEREAKTAEALRKSQAVVADVAAACGLNGTSLDRTVADAARRLIADTDALQRRAERAESDAEHDGHHVLPTPDATNPEHLRWVANLLGSLPGLPTGIQGCAQTWGSREVAWSPQDVRVVADRLEAAHQQADANEELIEKAAAVIACECTDRGAARALLAAGLLAAADAAERGES